MDSSLPERAFVLHEGQVVVVRRGESGFHPVASSAKPRLLNDAIGVTPQQAAALFHGSMFGWDTPGARPEAWTEIEAAGLAYGERGGSPPAA